MSDIDIEKNTTKIERKIEEEERKERKKGEEEEEEGEKTMEKKYPKKRFIFGTEEKYFIRIVILLEREE